MYDLVSRVSRENLTKVNKKNQNRHQLRLGQRTYYTTAVEYHIWNLTTLGFAISNTSVNDSMACSANSDKAIE